MRSLGIQQTRVVVILFNLWTMASSVDLSITEEQTARNTTTLQWTDESKVSGTSYSVIVARDNPKPSSQFQDETRVRFFAQSTEEIEKFLVQFVRPYPEERWKQGKLPFGA